MSIATDWAIDVLDRNVKDEDYELAVEILAFDPGLNVPEPSQELIEYRMRSYSCRDKPYPLRPTYRHFPWSPITGHNLNLREIEVARISPNRLNSGLYTNRDGLKHIGLNGYDVTGMISTIRSLQDEKKNTGTGHVCPKCSSYVFPENVTTIKFPDDAEQT